MDYTSFGISNAVEAFVAAQQCEDACQKDPQCKSFTLVNAGIQGPHSHCWLKNGIPATVPKQGHTSGVVRPDNKEDYCNNYALTAVNMAKSNAEWKCGYSGERWRLDHNVHYAWCIQVPETSTQNETQTRKMQMEQCMKPSTQGDLAALDWCYQLDKASGSISFHPVIKNEKSTSWKSAQQGEYRVGVTTGSLITEKKFTLSAFPHWYLDGLDVAVLDGPAFAYHPDNVYGIKHLWWFSHPEDSPTDNNGAEGLGGYFKGLAFENNPAVNLNRCHHFLPRDTLIKPGGGNKLDVQILLKTIEVVDEADGSSNAEPYLWPFFFKIDERMLVPDHFYDPRKWTYAPGGEHGNIGKDYSAGQLRDIPQESGYWKTTLEQNPVYFPMNSVYVGAVVVLLEEDDVPSSSDVVDEYYPQYRDRITGRLQCKFLKSLEEEVDQLTKKGDGKVSLVKLFHDKLIVDPRRDKLDCRSDTPAASEPADGSEAGFADFITNAQKELQDELISNTDDPWYLNLLIPGFSALVNVDDFIGARIFIWKGADLEQDPYRSILVKWNGATGSEDGDFNLRVHLRAGPTH
jgi:hypothetical protein